MTKEQRDAAEEEYHKICDTAWKEYRKICDPAWKIYRAKLEQIEK